jgi:hypothetical protein
MEGDLLRLKDCRVGVGLGNSVLLEGNEQSVVVAKRGFAVSGRVYERIESINKGTAGSMVKLGGKPLVDFVGCVDNVSKEANMTVCYVSDSKERGGGLLRLTKHGSEALKVVKGGMYLFRDVSVEGYDEMMGCTYASLGWQAVVEVDRSGGGDRGGEGKGGEEREAKRRKF